MNLRYLLIFGLTVFSSLAFANPIQHVAESGIPDSKDLITIQPHTRSAAVNARHAAECAEMGGIDITDNQEIIIGKDVKDIFLCRKTNQPLHSSFARNNLQGVYEISNMQPPYGTVFDLSGYYELSGQATFHTNTSGGKYLMSVSSETKDCSGSTIRNIESNTNETLTLSGSCFDNDLEGKIRTSVSACAYSTVIGCMMPWLESSGFIDVLYTPTKYNVNNNLGNPINSMSCDMLSPMVGDPINALTGNNFQQENDIIVVGAYPLNFSRYYNSLNGNGFWTHSYSAHLKITSLGDNVTRYSVINDDGNQEDFFNSNGAIVMPKNEFNSFQIIGDVYKYTKQGNFSLVFNASGQLIKTVANGGLTHYIHHLSDREMVVSDDFGNSMTVTELSNHLPLMVKTSSGIEVKYEYEKDERLVKMIKNGKSRTYHYEDSRFPFALTGISNENGTRYISWSYDSSGRAITSSNLNNVNKISVSYDSNEQSSVTNPLGRRYIYNTWYVPVGGQKILTGITGRQTPLVKTSTDQIYYRDMPYYFHTNGGLAERVYSYDIYYNEQRLEEGRFIGIKNLATSKDEYFNIKTAWDSRFNLPMTKTYPNQVITYDYDDYGNLIHQNITTNK